MHFRYGILNIAFAACAVGCGGSEGLTPEVEIQLRGAIAASTTRIVISAYDAGNSCAAVRLSGSARAAKGHSIEISLFGGKGGDGTLYDLLPGNYRVAAFGFSSDGPTSFGCREEDVLVTAGEKSKVEIEMKTYSGR